MTFFERLTLETKAECEALLSVPQIIAGMQGRISREEYLAYLVEAYHHVKHTLPLLMLAGGRVPESKKEIQRVFASYVGEETGHEDWILDDIRNTGGDAEKTRTGRPSQAIDLMVAYAYDLALRRNPIALFGMVFVLEGTSIQLATNLAKTLQKTLNLSENCFSYLTSHGSLDIEHMKFFEKSVNSITDTDDQNDIIDSARVFFRLFADVFRGIPFQDQKAAA